MGFNTADNLSNFSLLQIPFQTQRHQHFSIPVPWKNFMEPAQQKAPCTLLQVPGVSSLESVPVLLQPTLQHMEAAAELLSQQSLGR